MVSRNWKNWHLLSVFFGNDMKYLVAPPSLITKTLNKLRQGRTKEILMFPVWKSADYRPIVQKRCMFYEINKDIYYLSQKDCIFTGAGKNRDIYLVMEVWCTQRWLHCRYIWEEILDYDVSKFSPCRTFKTFRFCMLWCKRTLYQETC